MSSLLSHARGPAVARFGGATHVLSDPESTTPALLQARLVDRWFDGALAAIVTSPDVSLLLHASLLARVGVWGGVLATAWAGLGAAGINGAFARRRAYEGGGVDGGKKTTSNSSVSDATSRCFLAVVEQKHGPSSCWLQEGSSPSLGVTFAKSWEA